MSTASTLWKCLLNGIVNSPGPDPISNSLPDSMLEQTKKAFLAGLTAQSDYLHSEDEHKREVVKKLCSNISIRNNIVQSYQLKQPFQLIADMPKNSDFSKWLGW